MAAATYPIVWDATGEHLYETGVKKCVLYKFNTETKAYDSGVAWNGISSVSETPDGADEEKIFADDIKYLSLRAAEDLGGTIEAYMYPPEFMECDGSASFLNGGMYVGQQARTMFGLCYRTTVGNDVKSNDFGYKLHLVYGCTASPSERSYETINDSPEAITFSWEYSSIPVDVVIDGKEYNKSSIVTIDSTKCTPANLQALEEILYGKGSVAPRLPLPAEVYSILKAGA